MNFEEENAAVQSAETQPEPAETQTQAQAAAKPTKFCSHCGQTIDEKAIVCPHCGCQVEQLASAATPNIVINNSNSNVNSNQNTVNVNVSALKKEKNKWVALLLCLFLGYLGAHKFYEGKTGMGIIYLVTCGLFGVGAIIDFFVLLFKPNPYYV